MGKNKVYFGCLIAVVLLLIAYASYGMLNRGQKEKTYPVSVIVDNSSSDRWFAFREGLKQAARDNHIQLNIVSTGELATLEEEKLLIEREKENGAKGIIIQMCDGEGEEIFLQLQEAAGMAEVLLVETDVEPEGIYPAVIPENYEMGKMLAVSVKEDIDALAGKKIGILTGHRARLSQKQRLQGFLDEMEGTNVDILWQMTDNDYVQNEQLKAVEILVALENDETERAVDFLTESEAPGGALYGIGCSEKNVYYLDKRRIQVLIVPNEFHMGYQSVSMIAAQMQGQTSFRENPLVSFQVVRPEDLYEEDNQKLLFPLVQ